MGLGDGESSLFSRLGRFSDHHLDGPCSQKRRWAQMVEADNLDPQILKYLSRHYEGALATRGLWLWAGGQPAEIDFRAPPAERWQKLWSQAAPGHTATRTTLLREALFDRPGHPLLLKAVTLSADRLLPGGRQAAALISALLHEQGQYSDPEGDHHRLEAILHLFPHVPADPAFAITCPVLQRRLDATTRDRLERCLGQLADPSAATTPEALREALLWLLAVLPRVMFIGSYKRYREFARPLRQKLNHPPSPPPMQLLDSLLTLLEENQTAMHQPVAGPTPGPLRRLFVLLNGIWPGTPAGERSSIPNDFFLADPFLMAQAPPVTYALNDAVQAWIHGLWATTPGRTGR